eukprot:gene31972-38659_t
MLPKQILYIIALLILVFAFRVSLMKGLDRRRMEMQESREGKLTASSSGEESNTILPSNDIEKNFKLGDGENEDEEYDDANDEEEDDADLCGSIRMGDIEANMMIGNTSTPDAAPPSDGQSHLSGSMSHTVDTSAGHPSNLQSVFSNHTVHTEDPVQTKHSGSSPMSSSLLSSCHTLPLSQPVHTEESDPRITASTPSSFPSPPGIDPSIAHDHPPHTGHSANSSCSQPPTTCELAITHDNGTAGACHDNDQLSKSSVRCVTQHYAALDLTVPHLPDKEDADPDDDIAEKKYSPITAAPRPSIARGRTRLIRANTLHSLSRLVDFQGKKRVQLPYKVLLVLTVSWCCYLAIILGRTSVEKCSDGYIGLFIAAYVPLVACVVWGVMYNRRCITEQITEDDDPSLKRAHDDFRSIENKMLNENYVMLPIFTLGIGIVCALLGIGGGELFGPMMLHNHLSPVVTSATSSTLGLFNSLALVIRYIVQDEMSYNTGVILFFVGFFGGLLGRQLGLMFTVKYNRSSVIIFALCGAIFLGAIYYVYQLIALPFDIGLSNLCSGR